MKLARLFNSIQAALRAWDAKLVKGEPKLCVPTKTPEPVSDGDPLTALKDLVERSEEYWSAYECQEVSVPIAYDGKRIVYNEMAEEIEDYERAKLLLAAMFEHYLNHKLEGRLRKLWSSSYNYVLSRVYGRRMALESLRLAFKPTDIFDGCAVRAAFDKNVLTTLLFPSQKVKLEIGKGLELEESLEKLVLNAPDLERKMFAYALLAEAPELIGSNITDL